MEKVVIPRPSAKLHLFIEIKRPFLIFLKIKIFYRMRGRGGEGNTQKGRRRTLFLMRT